MKLLKKLLLHVCTLLIIVAGVLFIKTEVRAEGDGIGTAIIIADSLNVRSGPGKDNEALGKLEKNNNVLVLEEVETEEGYWFKVQFNDEVGYISAEFADYEPFEVDEIEAEEEADSEEEAVSEKEAEVDEGKAANYKLTFGLIAAIVLLLAIILLTVKSLKDGDFDGHYDDDDDYEDDDYDEDEEDDEEDEDEEDEYEYVMVRRPKQAPQSQQQYRQAAPQQQYQQSQQQYRQAAPQQQYQQSQQQYRQAAPQQQYQQPQQQYRQAAPQQQYQQPQQQYRQAAPQQQYQQPQQQYQQPQQAKPAKRLDDYTIDIDPSFFED